MTSITTNTKTAKKPRRMAREPKPVAAEGVDETSIDAPDAASPEQAAQPAAEPKPDKPTSKASVVLEMLHQPAGATIEQMVAATGWLPHTTRAVLTGFKKKGHTVTSDKVDGVRTYKVTASAARPTHASADAQPAADA